MRLRIASKRPSLRTCSRRRQHRRCSPRTTSACRSNARNRSSACCVTLRPLRVSEGVVNLRTRCSLPLLVLFAACGGENTSSNVSPPGADESMKTKALEAGADLLQDKTPLRTLNAYLDGFHFYSGDPQAQMEAHHY